MNRNLMFLTVGAIVLVGLVGAIVLQIVRPEAIGTFVQQIVVIVGLLVSAAGTIYGLDRVDKKIDKVEQNTNGRMSQLISENSELNKKIAAQTGTIKVLEQAADTTDPPR